MPGLFALVATGSYFSRVPQAASVRDPEEAPLDISESKWMMLWHQSRSRLPTSSGHQAPQSWISAHRDCRRRRKRK